MLERILLNLVKKDGQIDGSREYFMRCRRTYVLNKPYSCAAANTKIKYLKTRSYYYCVKKNHRGVRV